MNNRNFLDQYGNPLWVGRKVHVAYADACVMGIVTGFEKRVNNFLVAVKLTWPSGNVQIVMFYPCCRDQELYFSHLVVSDPNEKEQPFHIPEVFKNFLIREGGEELLLRYMDNCYCDAGYNPANSETFYEDRPIGKWLTFSFVWSRDPKHNWRLINGHWLQYLR